MAANLKEGKVKYFGGAKLLMFRRFRPKIRLWGRPKSQMSQMTPSQVTLIRIAGSWFVPRGPLFVLRSPGKSRMTSMIRSAGPDPPRGIDWSCGDQIRPKWPWFELRGPGSSRRALLSPTGPCSVLRGPDTSNDALVRPAGPWSVPVRWFFSAGPWLVSQDPIRPGALTRPAGPWLAPRGSGWPSGALIVPQGPDSFCWALVCPAEPLFVPRALIRPARPWNLTENRPQIGAQAGPWDPPWL